jgi:hypothetical protein
MASSHSVQWQRRGQHDIDFMGSALVRVGSGNCSGNADWQEAFGEEYAEYSKVTKNLVPGVS